MIKINYFDLGLHKDAFEVDMFISICEKNRIDYTVWGFEAHPEYCDNLTKKYVGNNKVNIINKAISNKDCQIDLYIADSNDGEGNSIFKSKNNVNKNKVVKVDGILFSNWLKENVENFEISNNILRFNIEGAEWHLMNDLDEKDMLKDFKIFLGSTPDMQKVSELKGYVNEYMKILKKNNIIIKRFTKVNHGNNCNLLNIINKKIKS